MSWNENLWLDKWNQAIAVKNMHERRSLTRPLLARVFKDTVETVRQGGYNTPDGWVDLNLNKDIEFQTVFYDMPVQSVQTDIRDKSNEIAVMPVDCLELARDIVVGNPDAQVCVLPAMPIPVEMCTMELRLRKSTFSDALTISGHCTSMQITHICMA